MKRRVYWNIEQSADLIPLWLIVIMSNAQFVRVFYHDCTQKERLAAVLTYGVLWPLMLYWNITIHCFYWRIDHQDCWGN